jgi:hypothetical protein
MVEGRNRPRTPVKKFDQVAIGISMAIGINLDSENKKA